MNLDSSGPKISSTQPSAQESATQSSTAVPTGTKSPESSSSSTNTGAIAGGVVGGVAGLALILAAIWFFLRRKRSQTEPAAPQYVQFEDKASHAAPAGGGSNPPYYNASELGELDARSKSPTELDGTQPRSVHELQ